jgi:hypothetical protein
MRFITDITLLGIMISGVLRKRNPTELWYMLYYQGLFWITAAIMTEVPGVVCRSRSYGSSVRFILLRHPDNAIQEHQR